MEKKIANPMTADPASLSNAALPAQGTDRRQILGWMVASAATPVMLTGCGGGSAEGVAQAAARTTQTSSSRKAALGVQAVEALPTKMINVGNSVYYAPGSHKTINIAPLNVNLGGVFDDRGRVTLAPGKSLAIFICTDAPRYTGRAVPGKWVATSTPALTVTISPTAEVSNIVEVSHKRSVCHWKGYGHVLVSLTNHTTETFTGDPDLRFFPRAEESRMKAGAVLQMAAKDDLSKNGVLRFLGDMSLNNSTITTASQIAKSEHAFWNNNIPPEVIGKIGTEANADVWVPSYHLMSSAEMVAYDKRLASTFKTGRVWKEYSNETWDGINQQMHYMVEFFNNNNLKCYDFDGSLVTSEAAKTDWLKNRAAYAQCCLDAWRAAESVFGAERVIRVFGGWAAVFELMKPSLHYIDPVTGKRLWQILNEDPTRSFVGIAPYFSTVFTFPEGRAARGCPPEQVNDISYEAQIRDQYWTGSSGGPEGYKRALLAGIDQTQAWVKNCKTILTSMGATDVKLVAYENGSSEYTQMSICDRGISCGCVVNYETNTMDIAGDNVQSFSQHFTDGDQISWSYTPVSTYPAFTTDVWSLSWTPQDIFVKVVAGGKKIELYDAHKQRIVLNPGLSGTLFGLLNATRYWRFCNFVYNEFFGTSHGLEIYKTYHAMLDAEGIALRTQFTNVGGADYSNVHNVGRDMSFWGMKRGYTDPDTPRSAWFNALPR